MTRPLLLASALLLALPAAAPTAAAECVVLPALGAACATPCGPLGACAAAQAADVVVAAGCAAALDPWALCFAIAPAAALGLAFVSVDQACLVAGAIPAGAMVAECVPLPPDLGALPALPPL